jgi:CMP-N-acetylneuraminic acid synthetase
MADINFEPELQNFNNTKIIFDPFKNKADFNFVTENLLWQHKTTEEKINYLQEKNNYQISVYNCSWVKNNYIFYNKNKNYKLFKNEFLTGKSCLFPSGVVWLAKIKKFMKEKTFYGKKYALHELPWYNSIDIDYEKDFLNAKIIKKFFKYPYV